MPLSIFYMLNFAASILAGVLFHQFVPPMWNTKPIWFMVAIMVFSFFLPGLGILCLIVLALFLLGNGQPQKDRLITYVKKPSQFSHNSQATQFGVGGVTQRLSAVDLSTQQRTEALLALSSLHTAEKNALVRQTLSDDTDQIRLLAFSLLDKQEKQISAKISRLRQQYLNTVIPAEKNRLEIAIAQEYWELIYRDLVQGDLKKSVLALAFEFAHKAWDEMNPDPQVAILLSKLYLMNHQTEQAEAVLTEARQQGAKASHVLPYLAAIRFQQRDFQSLRNYLQENPNLVDVPKLNQVIQFWRRET